MFWVTLTVLCLFCYSVGVYFFQLYAVQVHSKQFTISADDRAYTHAYSEFHTSSTYVPCSESRESVDDFDF